MRTALFLTAIGLLTLTPDMAHAQGADPGERLFRTRCGACHTVQPGQNRVGPHLNGVIGRKAGTVEGARYSQALRDSGLTWDTQNLASYLANPRGLVPGTTMTVAVPSEADRASILAYLGGPATSN